MSAIVIDLAARRTEPPSEYETFCRTRQAFIVAAAAWIRTAPRPDEVKMEIDGTIGAISMLPACFMGGGGHG